MSRGRDYVTREELVETIKERFRKIEEVGGGNGQAEGGGALGSSYEAGGAEAGAGAGELGGVAGDRGRSGGRPSSA
jgi:hypothetical protein